MMNAQIVEHVVGQVDLGESCQIVEQLVQTHLNDPVVAQLEDAQ